MEGETREEADEKMERVETKRYLCGGQHRVFIQAEHGVGHDGLVGQEAAAHHLHRQKHCLQSAPTSDSVHL